MRGADTFTESLFTMQKLEDFVPADHPLRPIRQMVNAALVKMDALFSRMYEADIKDGRPSIAPEKLLRAMLLQVFYSIRSERQLMEQTQYNLLFRWFIGLAMDVAVWVPTVFTKNRERLIEHDAVIELFNLVLEQAEHKGLLSGEHFSVDGIIRPPLVYGPGVKANFATLMRAVQRGWPLPLGAVHNQRSLVALDNLVDFIVTCVAHPQAANQTFLVSDGHDLSTTELVRGLARAAGVPARLLAGAGVGLASRCSLAGQGRCGATLVRQFAGGYFEGTESVGLGAAGFGG